MNKTTAYVVIGLVVLLGLGYVGRHKIKKFLGMSPAPATAITPATSPSPAASNGVYMTKTDTAKGMYMTDEKGMTLYTYDKDAKGVSNCSGACLVKWPAYGPGSTTMTNLPADVTEITRTDGTKQYAWKGMPLYYFAQDTKAGDVLGDGVLGVWHIVKM